MKDDIKKDLSDFLRLAALFIYGALTIATCAAVWNSKPRAAVSVFSALLLLANAYVIYRKAKRFGKDDSTDLK